MTRQEHLKWAKERALEYVRTGDLTQGYTSFVSDLIKHPETEKHSAIELGFMMLFNGHLNSQHEMKKFIEGFN